jgi:hypothetical protein
MPLLKPDAPPLPPAEVSALRQRLARPYDHELVVREDRRFLFLRSGASVPDPVADLEQGFEVAPAWAVRGLSAVYLLGTRSDLHVPGHVARPVYDRRVRLDAELAREALATCDVQYGVRAHRTVADPPNHERLLVRIPRERCAELQEADLVELARRIGPLHELGALRFVRTCHLVAETDHVRFRARDFLDDIVARWTVLREAEAALAPAPPTFEPAPRVVPTIVEDVTPVFEIEVELNAVAPHAVRLDAAEDAETRLAHRLAEEGFRVTRAPFLPESPFALEAIRTVLYPNRLALLHRAAFDRAHADEALRLVRDHRLDMLLVLTSDPTPEAARRVAASNVKLLSAAELATLRP